MSTTVYFVQNDEQLQVRNHYSWSHKNNATSLMDTVWLDCTRIENKLPQVRCGYSLILQHIPSLELRLNWNRSCNWSHTHIGPGPHVIPGSDPEPISALELIRFWTHPLLKLILNPLRSWNWYRIQPIPGTDPAPISSSNSDAVCGNALRVFLSLPRCKTCTWSCVSHETYHKSVPAKKPIQNPLWSSYRFSSHMIHPWTIIDRFFNVKCTFII